MKAIKFRQLRVCSLLLLVSGVCQAATIRAPAVAGAFYSRLPVALDHQVESLLAGVVMPVTTGRVIAAVVPHAGYVYSGACAATLYSLIASGQFDRVIILSPSHYVPIQGVSLPEPEVTAYATPLGNVPVDQEVCNVLRASKGFVTVPGAGVREHAIEVQLPFLQKRLGTFRLVPLICGPVGAVDLTAVSRALAPYLGSNTLLLASSDFTHYGPNFDFEPFRDHVRDRLQGWLTQASGRVASLDLSGFFAHCEGTHDTICGDVPIRVLLATLLAGKPAVTGQVLQLALSGDATGNYRNSVSYAAIGFFSGNKVAPDIGKQAGDQEGRTVNEHRSGSWTPGLTPGEQKTLFAIANDTLKWCVNGRHGTFDFSKYAITPLLKVDTATFVTLKIQGGLRGCIGSLEPVESLYRSVHNNAVNAALRDPRFNPVQPEELPRIEVDVSVLSPIRDIPTIADFKIGQQGIILAKGRYRAVYLPEVATEQGWTVEETLASLSQKAGLAPDAWRSGATFKVFESVVLSEK